MHVFCEIDYVINLYELLKYLQKQYKLHLEKTSYKTYYIAFAM